MRTEDTSRSAQVASAFVPEHGAEARPFTSSTDPSPGIESGVSLPIAEKHDPVMICPPPLPARKRGKRMSRRGGQNPQIRIGKRADGTKYFFFQYWVDVPGQEEKERRTEVVGLVGQLTKREAERRKLVFLSELTINSHDYQIPSSQTFADAVKYYRERFAPRRLRASTFDIADGHLKKHLEPDWKDVPVEHVTDRRCE